MSPNIELADADRSDVLPQLRVLLTGGDRLRRAPARPLPFRVVNHYGPIGGDVLRRTRQRFADPQGPGGRPIANTRAFVLDRRGRPVLWGVKGELCLR
jgi:non-ribosomal peptide synthetase component F